MKVLVISILALGSFLTPLSGVNVVIAINGKEVRSLTLDLYQKPGGYRIAPKTSFKRAQLQEITVTAPSEGLAGPDDSLDVRVTGFAGSIDYFKANQHVAPGGRATFVLAGPAMQDFTPNSKQPTLLGRFEVAVVPIVRPQTKGSYKGLISLE